MTSPHTVRLIRHHLQIITSRAEDLAESKQRREILESVKRIVGLLDQIHGGEKCPLEDECPLLKQ